MKLYRASDSDSVYGPTCFAAEQEDAEAYLDNLEFGGDTLYECDVQPGTDHVLDLEDERDDLQEIYDITGCDHGWMYVGFALSHSDVLDRLVELGYQWVCYRDDFPTECVTWLWLGNGDNKPELKEIDADS